MAKKSQKENPENKSKLELALEKLDKLYGKGTVLTLDSKIEGEYDVISTGSIAFDWKTLGIGGFAKGKLYELMGWEGTGKTSVCGHATAECQKNGGRVLYIDGEHSLDKDYFKALGVDTSKLLISQPSSGEEGFNTAIEMIETGEIDLVIIDSDSSLIPTSVADADVGESSIGKKARLNSDAYPKLKNSLVKYKTCVIVISQYREKIGVMFGNPTTTQGGHALKYISDCRIEISKTAAKDGDVVYGNLTKVKSTKNKMSPPYRGCSFDIVYGVGIDKVKELIELGLETGILQKAGGYYYYEGVSIGHGLEELKISLSKNDLFFDIRTDIINKIKNVEVVLEEIQETNEFD